MAKPRAHAYMVVPLLALTLFLVGCPKRPATTGAVAPAPSAPMAAPAPAPAPVAPAPAPAPAPVRGQVQGVEVFPHLRQVLLHGLLSGTGTAGDRESGGKDQGEPEAPLGHC